MCTKHRTQGRSGFGVLTVSRREDRGVEQFDSSLPPTESAIEVPWSPLESEGATARRDYYDGNWRRYDKSRIADEENDGDSPEVASSKLMILQLKVVESSSSTRPEKWTL